MTSAKEQYQRALKGSPLFHDAPQELLDLATRRGFYVRCEPGSVIFKAGDPCMFLYFVLSGAVTTFLDGVEISTLRPGAVGGGAGIFEHTAVHKTTHCVSEKAETAAEILRFDRDGVDKLLEFPSFRTALIRTMGSWLNQRSTLLSRKYLPSVEVQSTYQVAVFDAKPYDKVHLTKAFDGLTVAGKRGGKAVPVTLKFYSVKLSPQTAQLVAGSRAVCVFVNDDCSAATLKAIKAFGVELVLLRCAGFNNVDLPTCELLGIDVARVPAYSPYAVAEHAFALLMTLNRHLHQAYTRVRDGNFSLSGLEGRDLHGLTCGVAGTGKIGRCFVDIARGCGMKILLWDVYPDAAYAKEIGSEYIADFAEFASKCDVISLHVPLSERTHHLVNDTVLDRMRKNSVVINTSRGGVVDAKALLAALTDGRIGGAGLDVYEKEQAFFFEDRSGRVIGDEVLARLINMPNVLVTSHQAFLTTTALTAIATTTKANLIEHASEGKRGKALTNAVLPPPRVAKI